MPDPTSPANFAPLDEWFTVTFDDELAIPTEARGGAEFWGRVVGRGLFPEEQFQRTLSLDEGEVLCWPEASR